MSHSPTLQVLRRELAGWRGGRERLAEAMRSATPQEIVTNLLQISVDPLVERVHLTYFVEDETYPPLELTFRELTSVLAEA